MSGERDNWDPEKEEAFGLQTARILRPIFEDVKAKLPDGIDFAILIFAPASDPNAEGRIIAMTTEPQKMAVIAAQWSLSRLRDP